jgi:peptidyl-tRNA hydrolase
MKYLVVGLGNMGREYENTRHNIGFMILDALAGASNVVFAPQRYGDLATTRLKNKSLLLLKPSTFMNLSGNAVRYWMQKEKIPLENLLIIVDDIALPFGTLRLKMKGGDAGHNGLSHIQTVLNTNQYNRLRFGIGSDYPPGWQVDYVLSPFADEEQQLLPDRIKIAEDIIKSFCLAGPQLTMTNYNNK